MRLLIFLTIFTCFISYAVGQEKKKILNLNNEEFSELIKKEPELVNQQLWNFFNQQAEIEIKQSDFGKALANSQKAEVIAAHLGIQSVLIKNYQQLVKICSFLHQDLQVIKYFEKYSESFRNEANKIEAVKLSLSIDDGFTFYYLSKIYSDPFVAPLYTKDALKYLQISYQTSLPADTPQSKILLSLTALQISRCFWRVG